MITCRVCEARTEAFLCNRCTRTLEQALAEMPALLHELDVTISRQDRGTGAALYAVRRVYVQTPGLDYEEGQTTLPATPWPFSWDAADLRWRIESTVVTWARHIVEARGIELPAGPACLRCTHLSCALIRADPGRLLLAALDVIRHDEAAAVLYDEIVSCHRDGQRAIDRQAPDVFAGRCDAADVRVDMEGGTLRARTSTCGTDLYAHLGDTEVRCTVCGRVYDVARRKRQMAAAVDEQWARPHLIADALTTLDEPVKASTLRTWIERGHIAQVGIDDDGHALYRVGDVRARIAAVRERMSA